MAPSQCSSAQDAKAAVRRSSMVSSWWPLVIMGSYMGPRVEELRTATRFKMGMTTTTPSRTTTALRMYSGGFREKMSSMVAAWAAMGSRKS